MFYEQAANRNPLFEDLDSDEEEEEEEEQQQTEDKHADVTGAEEQSEYFYQNYTIKCLQK